MVNINIINENTIIDEAELASIIASVQTQISRDLQPAWQVNASLTLTPRAKRDSRAWWIVITNTPEQASDLGYCDVTSMALPLGKIYTRPTRQFGTSLSVAISQETISLLTDPHLVELRETADRTRVYALDICGPVEHQRYGYEINGVLVSDFVFPSYFDSNGSAPFDQTGHVSRPFQVARGGHISCLDRTQNPTAWVDLTADAHDVTSRKQEGSRYHRRAQFRGNGKRTFSSR